MKKIQKTQVTTGVYWIEIAEANLSVLCGCPADSVKYLSKRGFITTKELNGTTFETGPNAILFSDLLVQNGSFSNLAEFPILQMLYKQGLIIPGHPNNNGTKPLLIGSKDQLESQSQYIFRGNYGLVSKQEMQKAKVSPEEAQELLRMKLYFSFGQIKATNDLVDMVELEDKIIEIKKGVFLKRIELNVFEFSYQDETVIVNLNLNAGERYGVPYPLGYHLINREYFGIIHTGDGDGWNENYPCSSSILIFQGKIYLLDTGPNLIHSLQALGISINEIEGIFHTHGHDDHFADLPTIMQADHKIKYFTTPLVRESVIKKLSALISMDEERFHDFFNVQDLVPDEWNNIDGLEVLPLVSPHPVETSIFYFRTFWNDGYQTYAHLIDIVDLDKLDKMISDDSKKYGINKQFYEKVRKNYLKYADVKKIDIGGGLIHGKADNFKNDPSKKILLSHMSFEPSQEERNIGSGSPFGSVDVLIPSYQDYVRKQAHRFITTYFPEAPPYQINMLLNNPIKTFNPKTIILKSGEHNKNIYIVITGNVELLQENAKLPITLSAGAIIGEFSALKGKPSRYTFRTINFVQALEFSCEYYKQFIEQFELVEDVKNLREARQFLQETWLMGEAISYPVQNKIAQSIVTKHYKSGTIFSKEASSIFIIKSGKLQRFIGKDIFETLSRGDFFGEDGVLFKIPSLFKVEVVEQTEIYQIPGKILLDIPVVRWKLYEVFEKRMGLVLDSNLSSLPVFYWRKEYSVNVEILDNHHNQLFEKANLLHEAFHSNKEGEVLEEVFQFLMEFTKYHFTEEEKLMKQYNYPYFESHRAKHEKLIEKVLKYYKKLDQGDRKSSLEFLEFLRNWIVDHILFEDRKYTKFFNNLGIF